MAITSCAHRTDVPCAACEMARRRGDLLLPLPDTILCSRQGCTAATEGATEALAAGWVMLSGRWICPEDAERGRLSAVFDAMNADDLELLDGKEPLDGIDQSDPGEIPELDLGGEG